MIFWPKKWSGHGRPSCYSSNAYNIYTYKYKSTCTISLLAVYHTCTLVQCIIHSILRTGMVQYICRHQTQHHVHVHVYIHVHVQYHCMNVQQNSIPVYMCMYHVDFVFPGLLTKLRSCFVVTKKRQWK